MKALFHAISPSLWTPVKALATFLVKIGRQKVNIVIVSFMISRSHSSSTSHSSSPCALPCKFASLFSRTSRMLPAQPLSFHAFALFPRVGTPTVFSCLPPLAYRELCGGTHYLLFALFAPRYLLCFLAIPHCPSCNPFVLITMQIAGGWGVPPTLIHSGRKRKREKNKRAGHARSNRSEWHPALVGEGNVTACLPSG